MILQEAFTMNDKKVKGSILLDYVRMIRANKDKDWNKYLKPEDWDIINGRILPSMWYPLDTFQRAGLAAFHILGGGKLDLVRAWGRISMEQLVKGIYKSIIMDADPIKAIDKFVLLRKQFYNFSALEMKAIGDKHLNVWIEYGAKEDGAEPYCAQLKGGFERLVELTGGKNPKVSTGIKKHDGRDGIEFDLTWE